MGVDERLPPAKMPIILLWCSQPGIGDGQCLTLLQDTAGYALLNSPPCFGQAPAGGSSKWIPGQGGEGQIDLMQEIGSKGVGRNWKNKRKKGVLHGS